MAANTEAEKTRYSEPELAEFKELIEGKLEEGRKQLELYLDQIKEHTSSAEAKAKGLDDSTGFVASERLQSMAARQKKHLQHLEYALMRIENKVYGVCRESGKLISKERLRAVPHATLSIQAKKDNKIRRKRR